MKVYIGKSPNWFGTHQIAEKILFWKDRDDDKDYDVIVNLRDFLDKIPGLAKLCLWIYEKRERKIKVRVDKYDTWSADDTLALIIHPVLVALKKDKQGGPIVDDDDVPDNIKSTSSKSVKDSLDEFWFARWDYVLDEMIWAFEQAGKDWETEFYRNNNPEEEFNYKNIEVDREGIEKHHARTENGYRLFGKYYTNLWS
jgi:hypothetical protein